VFFIYRFALCKSIDNDRNTSDRLTVNLIAHAYLNRLEFVENVELRHTETRYAAVNDRTSQCHRVKPPATARPASGSTKLRANARKVRTHVIEQFRWERTRADASGVGLDDAKNVVEVSRSDTCPGAGGCRNGI